MATLRDIKRRIVGVKNTQQITKAMKMVAAAKLRRAQDNIINARPYSRKIIEVLYDLLASQKDFQDPLLENREVKNILIISITSDRGLCGSFNMNVIRETLNLLEGEYNDLMKTGNIKLVCIGKKSVDFFSRREVNIRSKYSGLFSNLSFTDVSKIIDDIRRGYINQEYDKVLIVYNEFKSIIQQKLTVEQLLPIVPKTNTTNTSNKNIDYIFEPGKDEIIKSMLPKYLATQFWRMLLESYAAELGARMTAMEMATDNAKELINELKLKYNKERQAAITKEILEIVSGANALKS